jgi:hypothetical protein
MISYTYTLCVCERFFHTGYIERPRLPRLPRPSPVLSSAFAFVLRMVAHSAILALVAELDRSHPAVLTLAGLAGVDPRTALSWLQGRAVLPAHDKLLSGALPRARAALPEHDAAYAARALVA